MNGEEIIPSTESENTEDEASIMADRDQTLDPLSFEREPSQTRQAKNLEDEPEDFIEGDVDVKTQMDRTERQFRSHIDGGNSDRSSHEDDRIPNA